MSGMPGMGWREVWEAQEGRGVGGREAMGGGLGPTGRLWGAGFVEVGEQVVADVWLARGAAGGVDGRGAPGSVGKDEQVVAEAVRAGDGEAVAEAARETDDGEVVAEAAREANDGEVVAEAARIAGGGSAWRSAGATTAATRAGAVARAAAAG